MVEGTVLQQKRDKRVLAGSNMALSSVRIYEHTEGTCCCLQRTFAITHLGRMTIHEKSKSGKTAM